MEFEDVLGTPDLGPGDIAAVQAHGRDIALANVGQTYYALDAVCPVDGTNLGRDGRLDGDSLVCPNDHARFDVRTGVRTDAADSADVTGAAGGLGARAIRVEGNRVLVGPLLQEDGDQREPG